MNEDDDILVPICSRDGFIVGIVGPNYTNLKKDREGLAQLKSGQCILIHTSQEEGTWGEIVSPERAVYEILNSKKYSLFKEFPDLLNTFQKMIKFEYIKDGGSDQDVS